MRVLGARRRAGTRVHCGDERDVRSRGAMRILIACEFSGVVRDAFIAKGWDAWSCDIIPTERKGPHIVNDVRNVLDDGWDMMIAHPPCTYLSYAGVAHWNRSGRAELRQQAADFFMTLYEADIPHVAIENPVGWMNTIFRKPEQVIHPYFFGDCDLKRTCLWLKGLQPLWFWKEDDLFGKRTVLDKPAPIYVHERKPGKHYQGGEKKNRYFVDHKGSLDAHDRSRTFPGIAAAMAEQWGRLA